MAAKTLGGLSDKFYTSRIDSAVSAYDGNKILELGRGERSADRMNYAAYAAAKINRWDVVEQLCTGCAGELRETVGNYSAYAAASMGRWDVVERLGLVCVEGVGKYCVRLASDAGQWNSVQVIGIHGPDGLAKYAIEVAAEKGGWPTVAAIFWNTQSMDIRKHALGKAVEKGEWDEFLNMMKRVSGASLDMLYEHAYNLLADNAKWDVFWTMIDGASIRPLEDVARNVFKKLKEADVIYAASAKNWDLVEGMGKFGPENVGKRVVELTVASKPEIAVRIGKYGPPEIGKHTLGLLARGGKWEPFMEICEHSHKDPVGVGRHGTDLAFAARRWHVLDHLIKASSSYCPKEVQEYAKVKFANIKNATVSEVDNDIREGRWEDVGLIGRHGSDRVGVHVANEAAKAGKWDTVRNVVWGDSEAAATHALELAAANGRWDIPTDVILFYGPRDSYDSLRVTLGKHSVNLAFREKNWDFLALAIRSATYLEVQDHARSMFKDFKDSDADSAANAGDWGLVHCLVYGGPERTAKRAVDWALEKRKEDIALDVTHHQSEDVQQHAINSALKEEWSWNIALQIASQRPSLRAYLERAVAELGISIERLQRQMEHGRSHGMSR